MEVINSSVDSNSPKDDKKLYLQVFSLVGILILTAAIVVTSLIWQHNADDNRSILTNDYHLAAADWSAEIETIATILLERVENSFKINKLLAERFDSTQIEIEHFTIDQLVEDAMYERSEDVV